VRLPLAPDLGTGGAPETAEEGRWEAIGSVAEAGLGGHPKPASRGHLKTGQ
jgi:hypothetical protein